MITKGKVVTLSYTLKDTDGHELDTADASNPFIYLHGAGQIVPGLELALNGLKIGDRKKVAVPPSEGYGEMIPGLKLELDRSQFPQNVELKEGMQFTADIGNGQVLPFRIESIQDARVRINGNHPLAGAVLHFDVEVLGVRDATPEEIAHGHAHGPGGHSH